MKAICIKDGWMSGWSKKERFCIEGKIYKYVIESGETVYPYRVDTESAYLHQMGEGFFNGYFQPLEDHFLPENLFDI